MNSRTTWILLVLAAVVGGVVIWDSKHGVSTEQALAKRKRLVDLKAEDVTRVELVRSNETVVLAKEADRWMLKQPLNYRANASSVSSLLNEIALAEADRVLAGKDLEGIDLAEFGLNAPRIRVKLQAPKGTVELSVGKETPTKEAVYVQVAGEKRVTITRKSLFERLGTKVGDLREHDVLDTPQVAMSRLEIKNAERALELTKSAAGTNAEPRWAISKPQRLRADQQKVSALASDLAYLRAAEFVADEAKDLHPYGLDEPGREVTVYTGDKSKTVQFGKSPTNDTTKVYARLKGTETVFTVSADTAQKFAVQPNDLRDAQVLGFDAAAVTAISIPPIEVRLDSNKLWNVTAPKPLPTDQERVKELLNKLSFLSATQFVADVATDLGRYGLANPAATVTVQGQGTNLLAQLLVSAPAADQPIRYVKRADEPFIYGVTSTAMDWLPTSPISFRKRQVAEFKAAEITEVSLQKGGKTVTAAKDKEGKWGLVAPTEGVLDVDTLNQVLEALSLLEARDYLGETATLANPEVKLAVKLGAKTLNIQIGPQTPNGDRQVAWSEPALLFTTAGYNLTPVLRDLVAAPAPAAATNAIPPAAKTP